MRGREGMKALVGILLFSLVFPASSLIQKPSETPFSKISPHRCQSLSKSLLSVLDTESRKNIGTVALAASWLLLYSPLMPSSAVAADAIIEGRVAVTDGADLPSSATAALYVTVRPDKPDNVPRAILDGSGGKPPPIAAARYPLNSADSSEAFFPFTFELRQSDLTEEGTAEGGKWWEGDDLIVSARLDSDGSAATRDSTDLVGRAVQYKKAAKQEASIYRRNDGVAGVEVRLTGRGLGGKFATARTK
jgi:hypothetical protein